MPHSASQLVPPRDFDGFLFAPVGDDDKGMTLTVLSALARLEFDPWQEAARLAGLPTQAAKGELAATIAKLPSLPSARSDSATIAERLIALLPRPTSARSSLIGLGTAPGLSEPAIDFQSPRFIISMALLAAMAILPLFVAATRQPPPDGGTATPISDPVAQQASVNSHE